jgi:4-carboxymuconolactone decarboxylase
MASGAPRIAPVTFDELDEAGRELLLGMIHNDGGTIRERTPADPVPTFMGTMLRHPRLFRKWAPFGGVLLMRGRIPVRDRELVCLRVAWLCQGAMEWGEHVKIAHAAGFTADDVDRVTLGPDAPEWDHPDRVVLRAVDELHTTGTITDVTWAGLAELYDQEQLIEFPVLVGNYTTTAYVQNALRIQLDPRTGGLESR